MHGWAINLQNFRSATLTQLRSSLASLRRSFQFVRPLRLCKCGGMSNVSCLSVSNARNCFSSSCFFCCFVHTPTRSFYAWWHADSSISHTRLPLHVVFSRFCFEGWAQSSTVDDEPTQINKKKKTKNIRPAIDANARQANSSCRRRHQCSSNLQISCYSKYIETKPSIWMRAACVCLSLCVCVDGVRVSTGVFNVSRTNCVHTFCAGLLWM